MIHVALGILALAVLLPFVAAFLSDQSRPGPAPKPSRPAWVRRYLAWVARHQVNDDESGVDSPGDQC